MDDPAPVAAQSAVEAISLLKDRISKALLPKNDDAFGAGSMLFEAGPNLSPSRSTFAHPHLSSLEAEDAEVLKRESDALSRARSIVAELTAGPEPTSTCICYTVIDADDPAKCRACGGKLDPVLALARHRGLATKWLADARLTLEKATAREEAASNETSTVSVRVEELEDLMDSRAEELQRIQRDLQVMAEKVADEIEKRTELQSAKDGLQAELDELTKSLFEEANNLKLDERQKREQHESREKSLEHELHEARTQLQMEQLRLREIKIKMEETRFAEEVGRDGMVVNSDSSSSLASEAGAVAGSSFSSNTTNPIDPVLLSEFKDFLTNGPTVKINKLHTLPFMKNALEDDVTPCLRFGGNPRTSTRKLVDFVMMHSCFVEEMTQPQVAAHQALLTTAPQVSGGSASNVNKPVRTGTGGAETGTVVAPPTQAIFQKTVLERISTWSTSSASTSATSSIVPGGCAACGRLTPVRFQFKISESADDTWCPICTQCRDRLVASCEFYNFVRHVRQGLYSTRRHEDLYLEMLTLKRKMFFSRMGVSGQVSRHFATTLIILAMDLYAVLGLESRTVSQEQIKRDIKAYKTAALASHPDKGGDPEKFKEISEAYQILQNPQTRDIYDRYGIDGLKNEYGGGDFASADPFFFSDPRHLFEQFFGDRNPFAFHRNMMQNMSGFGGHGVPNDMPGFGQMNDMPSFSHSSMMNDMPGFGGESFGMGGSGGRSMFADPFGGFRGGFGGGGFSGSNSSFISQSSFNGGGSFMSQSSQTRIVNGERTTIKTTTDGQGNTTTETVRQLRNGEVTREVVKNGVQVLVENGAEKEARRIS
ncbi:hypothetical protein HK101_011230 [Irineochytrium annulatum]|nr:hypothetical protein HK101_011230 [Irineochytrium annulatum]